MQRLSRYFRAAAAKRLSAVEAHPERSNQHELNGVSDLKRMLGEQRAAIPAKFIWVSADPEDSISSAATVTWYDARESHPTRSEFRLYFPKTPVSEKAAEGDLAVIARRNDDSLLLIIAEAGSTVESQILWLFGLEDPGYGFSQNTVSGNNDLEIGVAVRFILSEIEIDVDDYDETHVDTMFNRFGDKLPETSVFSSFARETLSNISGLDDPDKALIAWVNQEERLFRAFERKLLSERLVEGFVVGGEPDVDSFIGFSLSVQNRRKSRAGRALENHLEEVFQQHNLRFARGVITENRAKPDFLFPGREEYARAEFPIEQLTMLGVKSSCKDRWRQVLSEAQRIPEKHLMTLEPGISENQTAEMQANCLQLVVPAELHRSYTAVQRGWLFSVADFIRLAEDRQRKTTLA